MIKTSFWCKDNQDRRETLICSEGGEFRIVICIGWVLEKILTTCRNEIEMKINKVWQAFTQLTFISLKYTKGMFNPNSLGKVMSWYLCSHFKEQERNHWRNFFSSSGDAVCPILLKYQDVYVQIHTFTDENWNTLSSCSFECYWFDCCYCCWFEASYRYWKFEQCTFIVVQLWAIFVSDPKGSWFSIQKVNTE